MNIVVFVVKSSYDVSTSFHCFASHSVPIFLTSGGILLCCKDHPQQQGFWILYLCVRLDLFLVITQINDNHFLTVLPSNISNGHKPAVSFSQYVLQCFRPYARKVPKTSCFMIVYAHTAPSVKKPCFVYDAVH